MRSYFLVDNEGGVLQSNLSEEYISLKDACSVISERIDLDKKKFRHGKCVLQGMEVYLLTDEYDLVASSKLFKFVLSVYVDYALCVGDVKRSILLNILHEITSINARMIQEAYLFLPPDSLVGDYQRQMDTIKDHVSSNLEDASRMFNRICKNNTALKSKLLSLRALHGVAIELRKRIVNVRQVVLRSCHDHFKDLKDLGVEMLVGDDDVKFNFEIDFDTFISALEPFLENVVKYVLPNSKINVNFNLDEDFYSIRFDMMSLRIEDDERDRIFLNGFSGSSAKKANLNGQGIGLYSSSRLLALNGGEFRLVINRKNSQKYNENIYQNNIFEMIFKKNK